MKCKDLLLLGVSVTFFTIVALVVGFSAETTSLHTWAKYIGAAWALGAIVGSGDLIYKHLKYYSVPEEQKQIVRILLMVPIYATDSWVAMWEPSLTEYIDPVRDCYEAYVLYCFISLLAAYSGDEAELMQRLEADGHNEVKPLPPMCCLKPHKVNSNYMRRCRQGVMQYMLARPILVIVQIIMQACHVYDSSDGIFDFERGAAYIIFLTNISQTIAIYCLVYIYLALKDELVHHNPLGKFLCIKAVVFFSFWQTCFFKALVAFEIVQPAGKYSAEQICAALSDFCLIVEMLAYSLLHMYVFPFEHYRRIQAQGLWKTPWLRGSEEGEDGANEAGSIYRGMAYSKRDMLTNVLKQGDVAQDVWRHTPGHGIRPQAVQPTAEANVISESAADSIEAPLLTEDDDDESTELRST